MSIRMNNNAFIEFRSGKYCEVKTKKQCGSFCERRAESKSEFDRFTIVSLNFLVVAEYWTNTSYILSIISPPALNFALFPNFKSLLNKGASF